MAILKLPHGQLNLPAFLPDATFGVVRSVDSFDLEKCGIQALMMNTFHLMQKPGSSTIKNLNGVHRMSGWSSPIFTDSGGFQSYSLIRENSKYGSITDQGIVFRPNNSSRKLKLTPEKSIQLQFSYGADVLFCLDDCTHIDDSFKRQEQAVRRTIKWAQRSKSEFERLLNQKHICQHRPLLFAIIQGGRSLELRRQCAEEIVKIGFDGFGFGGWPLDSKGSLLVNLLNYTRNTIPSKFPMHALGIGHPISIVKCIQLGFEIFDCTLPTRDARKGRLYTLADEMRSLSYIGYEESFSYTYIQDNKYKKSKNPVSQYCDCLTCSKYSLSYLHHLFKINDHLYFRLATIHNLRFMARLIESLSALVNQGMIKQHSAL